VTNASPAPASPKVPVTAKRSPSRAPLRRSACRANVAQNLHAHGEMPRVVSPPTKATALASARSRKPAENRSSHLGSASGSVKASVATQASPHGGQSLKLTPTHDGLSNARRLLPENAPGDDGIHGRDQFRIARQRQHRCIIANPKHHAGFRARGAGARE